MGTEMIQIEKPATPAIVAELAPLVAAAREFEVTDVDTNRVALERVQVLRRGEKRLHELFEDSRRKADEAKKAILALRDGFVGPMAEARSIYDRKAGAYESAERERAAEQSRLLQERARKEEEERRLLDAIEAEAAGDADGAEAILDEPAPAPIIAVAPAVAKVEGVYDVNRWGSDIHDVAALVDYVAAHHEWLSLLEPERLIESHPNLNRLAVAQRGALSFPGVKAVCTTTRATR